MKILSLFAICLILGLSFAVDPTCDPTLSDFSCYYESSASTMWVAVKYGSAGAYNCQNACRASLCHTGSFYLADIERKMDKTSFVNNIVSNLAGIQCSNTSWAPPGRLTGSFVFQDDANNTRPWRCAVPTQTLSGSFREKGPPASASLICPCVKAPSLEQACPWSDRSTVLKDSGVTYAKFSDPSYSACLLEVNRRRKQACDEGWAICPPCGLPPMVECKACDACATSIAKTSLETGIPHSGGGRCASRAAGEVFASATCNLTIKNLIGREIVDTNGDGKFDQCTGHCGPFYRPGCESFSFGRWQNYATFQFGSVFSMTGTENCPGETCETYCAAGDPGCVVTKFVNDSDYTGNGNNLVVNLNLIFLFIFLLSLLSMY